MLHTQKKTTHNILNRSTLHQFSFKSDQLFRKLVNLHAHFQSETENGIPISETIALH